MMLELFGSGSQAVSCVLHVYVNTFVEMDRMILHSIILTVARHHAGDPDSHALLNKYRTATALLFLLPPEL